MEDSHKATHLFLSYANGKFSQAITMQEEEFTTLRMYANNDPFEGNFAIFTDILCSGLINLARAAGIDQMRYNKDM